MAKIVKLKKKNLNFGKKIIVALSLVATVSLGGYFFISRVSLFNIKSVEIVGNKRLTEEKILLCSGVAVGDNLVKLDRDEVMLSLKSEPYIESVEIQKKIPDKVIINIVEKRDILVVDGEKKIYLDSEGKVLSVRDDFKNYFVPMLEGLNKDSAIISKAIEYKNGIEELEFKEFVGGVSKPSVNERLKYAKIEEDNTVSLYFNGGEHVKLGGFTDMEYKLNYLETILKDLDEKEKLFETIDFTRGDKIIVEEKLVREEE